MTVPLPAAPTPSPGICDLGHGFCTSGAVGIGNLLCWCLHAARRQDARPRCPCSCRQHGRGRVCLHPATTLDHPVPSSWRTATPLHASSLGKSPRTASTCRGRCRVTFVLPSVTGGLSGGRPGRFCTVRVWRTRMYPTRAACCWRGPRANPGVR